MGRDEEAIIYLQFTNGTILFRSSNWDEIVVMKRIIRCFELASGLKVNLQKSIFVGLNCPEEVLRPLANKQHCKVGCLPIQYLWLHVGAN